VYVANYRDATLTVLDPTNGHTEVAVITVGDGSGVSQTYDVVFNGTNLFVVNYRDDEVVKLLPH